MFQWGNLERIPFFEENFIPFPTFKENFQRFLELLSVWLMKLHPTCRQKILSISSFFGRELFFHHFWHWVKKSRPYVDKIWHVRQNCILLVRRNKFKEWFFSRKILFFILSRQWAKTFRTFNGKILTGLSKQYFTCPSKHFDGIFSPKRFRIFCGHSAINCGPLSKFFQLARRSCTLRVHGSTLRQISFSWNKIKFISITFRHRAKMFRPCEDFFWIF